MFDILKEGNVKKTGIFAAGVLFGTAGIKMLTSKDAKKLYTTCTAAVLRAKDCIMDTATTLQENAEDIYAEAQMINEERAAMEEVVEEEDSEEVVEEENVESTDEEEADQ
jgi:hypothetical protein